MILNQLHNQEEALRIERRAEEEENLAWLSSTCLDDHPQAWMQVQDEV